MKPRRPSRPTPAARAGRKILARPRRAAKLPLRIALAAVALAVAAGVWWRFRPHPAGPAAPLDPFARLSSQQIYDTAMGLLREQRYNESLPFFRAALGRLRTDFMEIHRDYAGALYSATFELKPGGSGLPRVRSSLERIRLLQESLDQLARAQSFDMPPAERAVLFHTGGTILQAWGFPWETLLQFRGAYDSDPNGAGRAARVMAFMNLMQHPDRYALDRVPVRP